jgi:hypothetical protein
MLRECLCLISDLERDLDVHSWIEITISERRWLEPVLIQPQPHIFQSGTKVIIGSDPHLSHVHRVSGIRPQIRVELPDYPPG